MKRFLISACSLIAAISISCTLASAQGKSSLTAKQIVEKMSAQLERTTTEGFEIDLNLKMPIVGLIRSHIMSLGKKSMMEIESKDNKARTWYDGTTKWDYDFKEGTLTISEDTSADQNGEGQIAPIKEVGNGYKLSIAGETPTTWKIHCKKEKSNPDKDAPEQIDFTVSKETFLPVYFGGKKSFVTLSFENMKIGVSEESVTFNPADYPDARIIDKR